MKPMKAIAILAALLVLSASASAGDGWTDNYEEAKAQAKAENRFILLDFTGSDWCGWCIKLDKEVFSQSEFKKYADENLVCVTVDFPNRSSISGKTRKQNEELKSEFGIRGYPTIILLDPDGKKVAQTGYQAGGAETYVKHLEELLGSHRKKIGPVRTAQAAPTAQPGGFRTWTSAKGSTIEARMDQRVGNMVYLRTRDNRTITIAVDSLSPADQDFLRSPPAPVTR